MRRVWLICILMLMFVLQMKKMSEMDIYPIYPKMDLSKPMYVFTYFVMPL